MVSGKQQLTHILPGVLFFRYPSLTLIFKAAGKKTGETKSFF